MGSGAGKCTLCVDGQDVRISTRVWKMIRWLLEEQERVNGRDKLQVTFDCAGERVVVAVKERVEV